MIIRSGIVSDNFEDTISGCKRLSDKLSPEFLAIGVNLLLAVHFLFDVIARSDRVSSSAAKLKKSFSLDHLWSFSYYEASSSS